MTIKPEELMRSLQKKTPQISVMTAPSEEISAEAFELAKSHGYKVSSKSASDPSDPGGCMSFCTIHEFRLD